MPDDAQTEREIRELITELQRSQAPGQIGLSLGAVHGLVLMLFGMAVTAINLTPGQCGSLLVSLRHYADEAQVSVAPPQKLRRVNWTFDVRDGQVHIEFRDPVDQLRLTPEQARGMAASLERFGLAAERQLLAGRN